MSRRPHWDDDLIDAVFRALSHTYRAQGWTGGIAIDLDESVYPLIAAVEDWHKAKRDARVRTHSDECWRWHQECAEHLIERQRSTIQRVRELCDDERFSQCSCGRCPIQVDARDILRALDSTAVPNE